MGGSRETIEREETSSLASRERLARKVAFIRRQDANYDYIYHGVFKGNFVNTF